MDDSLATSLPGSDRFDKIAFHLEHIKNYRQESIKSIGRIVAFNVTGPNGGQWYVDVKESGTVGKGLAPVGKTPDVTLELEGRNFEELHLVRGSAVLSRWSDGTWKVTSDGSNEDPENKGLNFLIFSLHKIFGMARGESFEELNKIPDH